MLYSFDLDHAKQPISTVSDDATDQQLMAAIQQQDDHALEILISRHRALLRTIVNRVVNDMHDADEVLQDCFCEVWQRADTYSSDKGEPLGWLVTLVRRRAIDRTRRIATYRRACDRFQTEVKQEVATDTTTDEQVAQLDRAEVFSKMIGTLPPPQQEVLRLAFFRGMSQRQIAAETHQPLGTIKTRLELAIKKLRRAVVALGEMGDVRHFAHA